MKQKKPTAASKNGVFMSIRLDAELRQRIREQARKDERTLTGQILYYVRRCLDQEVSK